ncbi:hypothetical protein DTO013E5_1481 [Penicillium roqueforti]|uniref:uncharacterized protein n=1 Tax=Penicillium roqueforti TaxID=5082 RepID=UPI001909C7E1|nr:uncharacterized protein LCP9604111_4966 [Penicillium roqueforti]KAF9248727.1 hypothetical protein LCP9604111_4966 [Penicillium roqueforti]KAI1838198.1 hypothetical protein CBS147337_1421 [Penicillium roqueforti]KAI2681718.1 hypothetical protein CBS147355_2928 [Penicillium roqueforti]KAI2689108.1 hypothetical protein LCP963914a_2197 [Penicillium roqueforti]KAI2703836.1 hypothetical protein CBS147372_2305 [Penicillium roqueforti]
MFIKPLSGIALLLHAAALTSAEFIVKIGYFGGLVPGLPSTEPGVGCGLYMTGIAEGQALSVDFLPDHQPTDDCPAADLVLFCSRWGCPFETTFEHLVEVTVLSDDSSDKSITVTGLALSGRSATVKCPWTPVTIGSQGGLGLYQEWVCDLSATQG